MAEQLSEKTKPRTRRKTLYIILGVVAAIAVTAYSYLFVQMHAASAALRQYAQALVSEDYERAYNLTNPDFKEAMSETQFVEQQTALETRLGRLRAVKVGPSETEGNQSGWSSTVSANFEFEHGSLEFVFVMKKDGSSWGVYSYREQ